ncbi:MAG: SDR family NAD(P)-dependent oxidoreductase [Desulfobacterales bacterium]
MKLEGKVAIVTGAGKGIGQGIVHCLAKEGADIVINTLHEESAAKVADEVKALGRKSLAVAADVTTKEGADSVVQKALDTFGKIDILVNNFGAHTEAFYTGTSPTFVDQDIKEWDDDYEFNLKSQVLVSLAATPHFIKQASGKIINISSIAGRLTVPSQMPYGAFKAGSIYFTRTLAVELGKHNINVNCVCPGGIYSGMSERFMQKAIDGKPENKGMTPREFYEKHVQPNAAKNSPGPIKRELVAEDIGHAVVFFASEEARNITGQSLTVDCGMVTY